MAHQREQIDAEQAETRQRVASAEQAAKAAQDNAEALQAELTASRTAVEQASVLARAAQERAEAVQRAEDARRVRGTWARLRAAWRGE